MRTLIISALIFSATVQAHAVVWFNGPVCWFDGKQVNKKILMMEIEDSGIGVEEITCSGIRCRIVLENTNEPTQQVKDDITQAITDHTYRNLKPRRNAIKTIAQKLKAGTATTAEKNTLLLFLLRQVGLGE